MSFFNLEQVGDILEQEAFRPDGDGTGLGQWSLRTLDECEQDFCRLLIQVCQTDLKLPSRKLWIVVNY